jgi:hypothetical protein
MKPFTKRYKNDSIEKYPIISKKTGKKYFVTIQPYYLDEKYYKEGCIVRLYDGKFRLGIFPNKQLIEIHCKNENGIIKEEYPDKDMHSNFPYNLIGLAKYAVASYEINCEKEKKVIETFEKDFEEFEKWDGVV